MAPSGNLRKNSVNRGNETLTSSADFRRDRTPPMDAERRTWNAFDPVPSKTNRARKKVAHEQNRGSEK